MFTPSGHLFRIDQVPDHFKELFIISGYRNPRSSPKQCVLSIFEANNETFNFWTHFIPALYYWYLGYMLWGELDFENDAYCWPMLAYLLCVCSFPIVSATAHIFNTMSDTARHLCFIVDYGALSVYSMGAAIAYHAYVFPISLQGSIFSRVYLYVAAFNAVVCIILSCQTRFMPMGIWKKVYRILAFAMPYTFVSLPLLYRIAFCSPKDCASPAMKLHSRQFVFAIFAAFFYISHIPERFFPGKFDIVGHSHQIFHIISTLASHDQLYGLLADLHSRRHLVTQENIPTFSMTLGLMAAIAVVNTAVMVCFIIRLYRSVSVGKVHEPSATQQNQGGHLQWYNYTNRGSH